MTVRVQRNGANLILWEQDGSRRYAVAAPGGVWYVSGDPTPPPGAGFAWPFDPNLITTEWEGYPGHKGVDWGYAGVGGQDIHASEAGTVEMSGWYSGIYWGWGNMVMLNHGPIGVGGAVLRTVYAHMRDTPLVSVSDTVAKWQVLGIVGTTGDSTGDHLHWETSVDGMWNQINPRDFMAVYGE